MVLVFDFLWQYQSDCEVVRHSPYYCIQAAHDCLRVQLVLGVKNRKEAIRINFKKFKTIQGYGNFIQILQSSFTSTRIRESPLQIKKGSTLPLKSHCLTFRRLARCGDGLMTLGYRSALGTGVRTALDTGIRGSELPTKIAAVRKISKH